MAFGAMAQADYQAVIDNCRNSLKNGNPLHGSAVIRQILLVVGDATVQLAGSTNVNGITAISNNDALDGKPTAG